MNKAELVKRIAAEANNAICVQNADGSMPAGCNGPYKHSVTALRTTGHWLITWLFLWERTGQAAFRAAAEKALRYMLGAEHRPGGANWVQRNQKGRDVVNGIIGAAWTGEALWAAARQLKSVPAAAQAIAVFERHVFDSGLGLWHRLSPEGRSMSVDQTLNHQIWFSATAARLGSLGSTKLREQSQQFLEMLPKYFVLERSGVIRHRIPLFLYDRIFYSGGLAFQIYQIYRALRSGSQPMNTAIRDLGYHAFNLHGLAILHQYYPDNSFWKSDPWKTALAYGQKEVHINGVADRRNVYAYPYNPVGFEMAFILSQFSENHRADEELWVERQWESLTDRGNCAYGAKTLDPQTAQARLYEGVQWLQT